MGDGTTPGPVYVEIPPDVLRETVHPNLVLDEYLRPKPPRCIPPDPADVERAAAIIAAARRPLVITGRGAMGAGEELVRFLDASGAVYLDTQESRGLVPSDHPSVVGAVRGRAMQEADLVVVIGRKLDYQLGYGSPAVFPQARFIRIADCWEELRENRRGDVELFASPAAALAALSIELQSRTAATSMPPGPRRSGASTCGARRAMPKPWAALRPAKMATCIPIGSLPPLSDVLDPDAITIADGGDILSFARVGLTTRTYLDSGAFGCLGVGIPYGNAAALAYPGRQVVVVSGDGAFGINAMEIDTAKRHDAKAVFVIANNAAWNIERLDQEMNYGGRVVGTTLQYADYAMMARAFGLHAERVTDPERLRPALEQAFVNAPALIDVVITQDAMSSDAGKGLGAVLDYQALTAWDDAERRRRGEEVAKA